MREVCAEFLGHAHKTAVNEQNGWQLGQFLTFLFVMVSLSLRVRGGDKLIFCIESMTFKARARLG